MNSSCAVGAFLFLLSGIIASPSFAKSLTWKDSTFSINVQDGWKEAKDLYGIPVTLLGPIRNQTRPIVQIIPTSIDDIAIKPENAKGFGEKYAVGRKDWLSKQNGKLIELLPGRYEVLKSGSKMLYAGVSYQINQKAFIERTFYISCPKKIFHLKIVQNFELVSALKDSEDVVRSFACKE